MKIRPPHFFTLFSLFCLVGCGQSAPPQNRIAQAPEENPPTEVTPAEAAPPLAPVEELVPDPETESEVVPTPTPAPSPTPVSVFKPLVRATKKPLQKLPAIPLQKPLSGPRVEELRGKIARAGIFAAYDELIALHKKAGLFDEAARLEREQVPLYRKKGLLDAAIIHEQNARNLETTLATFGDVETTAKGLGRLHTGAPLEPFYGCYSGAFIDRDDTLGAPWTDENWQTHRSGQQFREATGKNPASLFMYLSYGRPFPKKWCEALKAEGIIPHIAWEPKSLAQVKDDQFLNDFGKAIRELDWPVFIRFASEMNGAWTPYNGNPTLYKQKFALVHRVLHHHAPRVATIWCVNNPPLDNAFDYYPGDEGCDWVGVNFYAVPFENGKREKPVFEKNPLGLLDPIYQKYAAKKPIAICEFAASHLSPADGKTIPDFAASKLRTLYGALPLLYPRVKLINWFSMNTIKYPTPGKTRNNYDLTDHPQVLSAWQETTDAPHFLHAFQRLGDPLPPVARPLAGQTLKNGARVRFFAKSFDPQSRIFAQVGKKLVFEGQGNGAFEFVLNAPRGPQTLTLFVYDSKNRFQKQTVTRFKVA